MRLLIVLKIILVPSLFWTVSAPALADSDPVRDFSGTYVSAITSQHPYFFRSPNRNLVIEIEQTGDLITATDSKFNLKIEGRIDHDTINFYMYPNRVNGRIDLLGSWKIDETGSIISGSWDSSDSYGRWDLFKL
jgi:hypothetical protein